MKKHYAIAYETTYGYVSTTLCGRGHADGDAETDNNVTNEKSAVTCKTCGKIIANKNHWRHRKYLSSNATQHLITSPSVSG